MKTLEQEQTDMYRRLKFLVQALDSAYGEQRSIELIADLLNEFYEGEQKDARLILAAIRSGTYIRPILDGAWLRHIDETLRSIEFLVGADLKISRN
jgi:hypothetical protein